MAGIVVAEYISVLLVEIDMRYSKFAGHLDTPKGFARTSRGKWYDIRDFLELRDIEEQSRGAPRPPPVHALIRSTQFDYHRLGLPIRN